MLIPIPPIADQHFVLRLFVAGSTMRSARAVQSLRLICDTYLKGRHELEVLDLYQCPEAAAREQIIAVPTLIRMMPMPLRRVIGDLSDHQRVLASLDICSPSAGTH